MHLAAQKSVLCEFIELMCCDGNLECLLYAVTSNIFLLAQLLVCTIVMLCFVTTWHLCICIISSPVLIFMLLEARQRIIPTNQIIQMFYDFLKSCICLLYSKTCMQLLSQYSQSCFFSPQQTSVCYLDIICLEVVTEEIPTFPGLVK